MLKMSSTINAWTCVITDCCNLQKCQGDSEWFDRHQTCVGEVSLYIKLKLNTLGCLNVPQIKI